MSRPMHAFVPLWIVWLALAPGGPVAREIDEALATGVFRGIRLGQPLDESAGLRLLARRPVGDYHTREPEWRALLGVPVDLVYYRVRRGRLEAACFVSRDQQHSVRLHAAVQDALGRPRGLRLGRNTLSSTWPGAKAAFRLEVYRTGGALGCIEVQPPTLVLLEAQP